MLKSYLFTALTLLLGASSNAQITPREQLSTAQEELRIASSALTYADNDADFRGIENNIIRGLAAFDTAMMSFSVQKQEELRPYRSFFLLPGAIVQVKQNKFDQALPTLLMIDSVLSIWHDRDEFSLDNPFDSTELLLTYYMVAETRSTARSGLAACYFHEKNYSKSLEYDQMVIDEDALEYETSAVNYLRANIAAKALNTPSPTQRIDFALEGMERYGSLAEDVQGQVDQQLGGNSALDRVIPIFEADLAEKPEDYNLGEAWARAARVMTNETRKDQALTYTKNALTNGYDDQEFLLASIPVLKGTPDSIQIPGILNQLAQKIPNTDCSALSALAEQYEAIKMTAEAARFKRNAENCRKQERKAANLANRDFGLYVGGYVLPLFRTDWGVVSAIQTRRHFFEVSYQQLTDRRDKLRDLRIRSVDGAADQVVRWDGYYGHVSINKLKGKRGAKTYSGLLLGYNLRQYQSFDVPKIINGQDNQQVNTTPVTFSPIEERFIVMLNSGSHFYGRWLAGDVFFSWGGAMAQFQRGNKTFDFEDYEYDNPMLDSRKARRFIMMARFGITVGLQVGTRTFKK
jgi:tetratricopeptide (TPR) repeat protein